MPHDSHRLAVVTGTSSGIGEALARALLKRGWHVIGIARRAVPIRTPHYSHVQIDLADVTGLTAVLDGAVGRLVADSAVSRLALVNNAAAVALQGQVEQLEPQGMLHTYAVNTVAPVLLMGWVLRNGGPKVPVRIVNVSSGAAVDPYPGLGAYGNAKAALRMAGMVLAAELDFAASQGGPARDVTVWSYEPGVVDTPMQLAVRSSAPAIVPIVEVFNQFHATGMLRPPAAPADEIADHLEADGHPRFSEQRFVIAPPPGE